MQNAVTRNQEMYEDMSRLRNQADKRVRDLQNKVVDLEQKLSGKVEYDIREDEELG